MTIAEGVVSADRMAPSFGRVRVVDILVTLGGGGGIFRDLQKKCCFRWRIMMWQREERRTVAAGGGVIRVIGRRRSFSSASCTDRKRGARSYALPGRQEIEQLPVSRSRRSRYWQLDEREAR